MSFNQKFGKPELKQMQHEQNDYENITMTIF